MVEDAVISKETGGAVDDSVREVVNIYEEEEGPRTEPCGTPERTGLGPGRFPSS